MIKSYFSQLVEILYTLPIQCAYILKRFFNSFVATSLASFNHFNDLSKWISFHNDEFWDRSFFFKYHFALENWLKINNFQHLFNITLCDKINFFYNHKKAQYIMRVEILIEVTCIGQFASQSFISRGKNFPPFKIFFLK